MYPECWITVHSSTGYVASLSLPHDWVTSVAQPVLAVEAPLGLPQGALLSRVLGHLGRSGEALTCSDAASVYGQVVHTGILDPRGRLVGKTG